jgi:4-amino-4-deoxy-L-arabinose transferase-like glycosyltransferase
VGRRARVGTTATTFPVVAVALGSVLLLAAVLSVALLGDELRYPDERDYLRLARSLADDGRFAIRGEPTASRPPGYPFLLAPFVAIGVGTAPLRLVNFVCLAGTAYCVYRLVRLVAPPAYGYLAAAGVIIYPFSLYTAGTFYPQVPSALALVGSVLLLHRGIDRRSHRLASVALSGLLFGASILMVPNQAFLVLVVVAWIAFIRPHRRTAVLGVFLAATAVLPAAWTARNLVRFEEVVFISTNGGLNLLLGNSEDAGANSGVNVDISRYEARGRRLGEFERDRYYRDAALDWVRDNPGDALALYARKVANYFNFRNDLYVNEEASPLRDVIGAVSFLPLLALLAVRLALARRYPPCRLEGLVIGLYLSNAVFLALFFTRVRFRLPLDLLLIAGLCIFLARAAPEWRRLRATEALADA